LANWGTWPHTPFNFLLDIVIRCGWNRKPAAASMREHALGITQELGAVDRRLPIYPIFGRGLTGLQPAFVEDVAEAVARALQGTETHAITYECGGPRVHSYEEFLRAVAHSMRQRSL
jgi:nucleoside-diphosphate-sugar epimerase